MAHPNCQQKLVEIWYTGIRKVTKMNQGLAILLLISFLFFLPFGSLIFMIAPNTKVTLLIISFKSLNLILFLNVKPGKFMCLPFIKFLTFTISYMGFVCMIIASSLQFESDQKHRERFSHVYPDFHENFTAYVENEELHYRFEAPDFYIRKNQPDYLDIAICIWLFGTIMLFKNK